MTTTREHVEAALWQLLGASGVETTTKTPQRVDDVLRVVDEYLKTATLQAARREAGEDDDVTYTGHVCLGPGQREGNVARCKKCLEVKPVSEFYHKSDRKEGIATACKACHLVMYEARRSRRQVVAPV